MTLDKADLYHVHKVLTSDTAECRVWLKPEHQKVSPSTPKRIANYKKRIRDNKRVIARIECILGEHLTWS